MIKFLCRTSQSTCVPQRQQCPVNVHAKEGRAGQQKKGKLGWEIHLPTEWIALILYQCILVDHTCGINVVSPNFYLFFQFGCLCIYTAKVTMRQSYLIYLFSPPRALSDSQAFSKTQAGFEREVLGSRSVPWAQFCRSNAASPRVGGGWATRAGALCLLGEPWAAVWAAD